MLQKAQNRAMTVILHRDKLLRDKFVIVGNENQRLTRQAGNIVLELRKTRSAERKKVCFMKELKCIISCQPNLKQSDRLKIFKHELKGYILSRIKYI